LSDLKFVSTNSCNNIVGGYTNIGRSANSIISGKGNFVASSESFVVGSNNKLYNKTYAGPTSATASLYTYHKSNAVLGDNNQLKGRYNKIFGDRNTAITEDGSTAYRQNLKIIGNDNIINSDDKIVIGNSIVDPTNFITLGNGAEAIGIGSDNTVYLNNVLVASTPTKNTSVLRKLDVINGSLDGSFSTLKINGSNVITNNTFNTKLKESMSSTSLFDETTVNFNRLQLDRKGHEAALELKDAIRFADICTATNSQSSTGATYGALNVKFASIKMKATPGNDGGGASTGNGSTFIEPDRITTNEIAVKDITGNIDRLNTTNKNIIDAINEINDKPSGSGEVVLDNTLTEEGKAADAKAVGDKLKLAKDAYKHEIIVYYTYYIGEYNEGVPSIGGIDNSSVDYIDVVALPYKLTFVDFEDRTSYTYAEVVNLIKEYGAVFYGDSSEYEGWDYPSITHGVTLGISTGQDYEYDELDRYNSYISTSVLTNEQHIISNLGDVIDKALEQSDKLYRHDIRAVMRQDSDDGEPICSVCFSVYSSQSEKFTPSTLPMYKYMRLNEFESTNGYIVYHILSDGRFEAEDLYNVGVPITCAFSAEDFIDIPVRV
jgi:hypothetical protein